MGVGDLLRLGRVGASVLRLVGGYRAAVVLGLVLSVGWFVVGLSGDAHAAGVVGDPGPVLYSEPIIGRGLGTALFGWFCVCVGVWVGILALLVSGAHRWLLRHGGDAVRGRSSGGANGDALDGGGAADCALCGWSRERVGA